MKSRLFTQVQEYSEAKAIFLEPAHSFFLYIAGSFYMESTCTAAYISPNKCPYAGRNVVYLKVLTVEE